MLKIRIHGVSDGKHKISLSSYAENIPDMFPEFFGEILVEGELTKSARRYKFSGTANCKANLICDISATDYTEEITTKIVLALVVDSTLYFEQKKNIIDYDLEIGLHEDDIFFDISEIVKDELAVSLPMRRISPKYKNRSFSDLYPEYTSTATTITNNNNHNHNNNKSNTDERWNVLKNIKIE